jgi:ArsR family transcriptional regulator, arsenate/arsenite/antimonite-responsive transcriptional repressor / arsenate reductase (thioredoxin)
MEEYMIAAFSSTQAPGFLKLLAHDLRWKILVLLGRSDYCVQEIVRMLEQPQNLVSYHLRKLRDQNLVTERRSSADGRDIYYSLDVNTMRTLYFAAAESLNPALNVTDTALQEAVSHLPKKNVRVLFLCTHNSARSQMAEGILRHLSGGRIEAFSAGNQPAHLHPLAIQTMAKMGLDSSQQRSKHMDEFQGQFFDYIVTVCDRVRESCPTFPGDPERVHWSFIDPAAVEGSEKERYRAFEQVALQLTNRIRYLVILIKREKGGGL